MNIKDDVLMDYFLFEDKEKEILGSSYYSFEVYPFGVRLRDPNDKVIGTYETDVDVLLKRITMGYPCSMQDALDFRLMVWNADKILQSQSKSFEISTKKEKTKMTITLKTKEPKKSTVSMNDTPIALLDAWSLYQPVRGTDSTSVYFCVGISNKVNVAARLLDGHLSLRIEGDMNHSGAKEVIKYLHMKKGNKGHYSTHMSCGSDVNMAKMLVVGALAIIGEMQTGIPELDVIVNKGK